MPLSNSSIRAITNTVSAIQNNALNWMQERSFLTEKGNKLTGDKLYYHLFGSEEPLSYSRTISNKVASLEDLLSRQLFPDPTLPPEAKARFNLTLRTPSDGDHLNKGVFGVSFSFPIHRQVRLCPPLLCTRYTDAKTNVVFSRYLGEALPFEPTHKIFLPKIQQIYGQSLIDQINGIVGFFDLTYNLTHKLEAYLKKCRSLGGAYNKLPILNSLCPNSSVEHVRFTRDTPDPDPELVQILTALATIEQARKASTSTPQEVPF